MTSACKSTALNISPHSNLTAVGQQASSFVDRPLAGRPVTNASVRPRSGRMTGTWPVSLSRAFTPDTGAPSLRRRNSLLEHSRPAGSVFGAPRLQQWREAYVRPTVLPSSPDQGRIPVLFPILAHSFSGVDRKRRCCGPNSKRPCYACVCQSDKCSWRTHCQSVPSPRQRARRRRRQEQPAAVPRAASGWGRLRSHG